jgi:hypothetical protein
MQREYVTQPSGGSLSMKFSGVSLAKLFFLALALGVCPSVVAHPATPVPVPMPGGGSCKTIVDEFLMQAYTYCGTGEGIIFSDGTGMACNIPNGYGGCIPCPTGPSVCSGPVAGAATNAMDE